MSIKAIMKATFWKNDDTFVNYYLRDIRVTCQYDTFGIGTSVSIWWSPLVRHCIRILYVS